MTNDTQLLMALIPTWLKPYLSNNKRELIIVCLLLKMPQILGANFTSPIEILFTVTNNLTFPMNPMDFWYHEDGQVSPHCLQAILVMGQLLHYSAQAFGSNFIANCGLPVPRSEQHIIKVWFSPNVAVVKQSSPLDPGSHASLMQRVASAVFQTPLITTKKILSTRNKKTRVIYHQNWQTSTFFFCKIMAKINWL